MVVGSLQQEIAIGRYRPIEGYVGCPVGGCQGPTGQVDGVACVVSELDPLVGGAGLRPGPGQLIDDHVQGVSRDLTRWLGRPGGSAPQEHPDADQEQRNDQPTKEH